MRRAALLSAVIALLCATAVTPALAYDRDNHHRDDRRGHHHYRNDHRDHDRHRSSSFVINFGALPYLQQQYRPAWRAPAYFPASPTYVVPQPVYIKAAAPEAYCREFTQQVRVGNRIQDSYGTACLQPDGSWQVVP